VWPPAARHVRGSGSEQGSLSAAAQAAEGFYSVLDLQAGKPINTSVFTEPTDGVYLVLNWSDIEPQSGQYNYSQLDYATNLSVQNGKKIILAVRSGNYAPSWIYQSPYNVQSSNFVYSNHGGAGACDSVTIAWPWDANYQQLFESMIANISSHLQSSPTVFSHLVEVKLTGLNTITEELHLPSSDGKSGSGCTESDAQLTWQQAGYTPNKVIAAWGAFLTAFANAFPDQLLAQAILVTNDFPLISNSGELLKSEKAPGYVDIKQAIVSEATQAYPGQFAINTTALTAYPQPSILQTYSQEGAIIGFQANEFLGTTGGSGCNAATVFDSPQPCTASGYEALLMNGVQSNGLWFEIWPPNAQQYPGDIVQADTALHNINP